MKTIPLHRLVGTALLVAAAFTPALHAGDAGVASIAFSRPSAPRTVRVETMNSVVTILGADVRDVTVRTSSATQQTNTRREDGLRVIASANSFNLTERDNVVRLSQDSGALFGGGNNFEVTVPRDAAVIVKISIFGSVTVRDLAGDIEISNLNGGVKLENVGGGVAVDTMNGEISAHYATLSDGKSHSFSSMNGKVLLYVPSTAKASFRLRAQNGTVATDLDEKVFVTKTEAGQPGEFPGGGIRAGLDAARAAIELAQQIARGAADGAREAARSAQNPPLPDTNGETIEAPAGPAKPPSPPKPPRPQHPPTFPAFGGQVVTGTLNGGGVEIRATTMNGEIQIRAAQ